MGAGVYDSFNSKANTLKGKTWGYTVPKYSLAELLGW